jgi:hypothetical protein
MTRYGLPTTYGEYTYGASSTPSISVTPFIVSVIDYDNVVVNWVNPVIPINISSGLPDIHKFRLLRNQDGIPDSPEDGTILVETNDSVPTFTTITDIGVDFQNNDSPIKPGHRIYYTIWLHLGDSYANNWVLAGIAQSVIPTNHSKNIINGSVTPTTHERMLDILPRVFTSSEQNMVDVVNYDSDLSKFLSSMSFTYDEIMTLVDLLLPDNTYQHFSPDLLNARAFGYNIPQENRPATKYTRKLVRDAITNYVSKGTTASLLSFVEDLTGYSPKLLESPNLFLSPADATFYKSVGNWTAIGDVQITPSLEVIPPAGTAFEEARRVDFEYTAKVVSSAVNSQISNGTVSPITQGMPVTAGEEYSFYFYCKSADEINVIPSVTWYDYLGNFIEQTIGDTVEPTSSWVKNTLSISSNNVVTAPANSVYAAVSFKFSGPATTYFDMMQFGLSVYSEVHEARSVGVLLTPTKKNLVKNPSVESSTSGWSSTNASISSALFASAIPGTLSGTKALLSESTSGEVTITVTSSETVGNIPDLVFSTYVYAESNTQISTELEVYTVEPYSNFVPSATSLPTSGTNWVDYPGDDGAWTAATLSIGGPSSTGGKQRVYTFTDDATMGVVAAGIDKTGIVPVTSYGGDAEYVARMWVNPSHDGEFYPEVTWWINGTQQDPVLGDIVSINGGVGIWTQIEFTVLSPVDVTDMRFTINSSATENDWVIGDTIAFAGAEVGYLTTISSSSTWDIPAETWTRIYEHVGVPFTRLPFNKQSASFVSRMSYTSNGDDVYFDAAMGEERYFPSDYFDGSVIHGEWSGTTNNSVSYLFVNKNEKLSRLLKEIPKYIPIGLPFYVESPAGVEFSGLFKGYA